MNQTGNDGTKPAGMSSPGTPRLWVLVALAFAATFLLVRHFSSRSVVGQRADYAWTPTALDGRPTPLLTFKGRPIFLNVWATWCGPCMREMPSIARLASNPMLVGKVDFLCVATDESVEPVRRYVAESKLPMTILHEAGVLPPVFRTEGIPATFLIAPDGRIVKMSVGSEDWDRPDVVKLLLDLVAESD